MVIVINRSTVNFFIFMSNIINFRNIDIIINFIINIIQVIVMINVV